MPVQFLSDAERARLRGFPAEVPAQDLIAHFTLGPVDRAFLQLYRGGANRLGVALQIGALRYLGFLPEDLGATPAPVVDFLARQLRVAAGALAAYAARAQTRSDHGRQVMAYLQFRKAEEADVEALIQWLRQRALEHDRPLLLLQLACQRLHQARIARPGVTVLERVVAVARDQARAEIYRRLEPLLTAERQAWLDALLHPPDGDATRPSLAWLRRDPSKLVATAIEEALARVQVLCKEGAHHWDFARLNPNRLKVLAQWGARASTQALQRLGETRRYPILLAFLQQLLHELTDHAIERLDAYLHEIHTTAEEFAEDSQRQHVRTNLEHLRLLADVSRVVLDPQVDNPAVRPRILEAAPAARLQAAIDAAQAQERSLDAAYFDHLGDRYSYLRRFGSAWWQTLKFHAYQHDDPLISAVRVLRDLDQDKLHDVPPAAPLGFVPARWKRRVVDRQGVINRRDYELCVFLQLRQALRAGDVWVAHSRRYADPRRYLIPRTTWQPIAAETCGLLQLPLDPEERLQARRDELDGLLRELDRQLAHPQPHLRLVVTAPPGERLPDSAARLRRQVHQRLPLVDLVDLLVEVDTWTDFSGQFEHVSQQQPRTPALRRHLYAGILAQACNIGLERMAYVAGLPYQDLAWYTTWFLREETLRAAVTTLVNFHHRLPLSAAWGGGTLSSSDGQRFPAAGHVPNATALPRYFGYGRGLTFYTWTSDQYSQYGTKVIPATVRDATYVLDEILDNQTELAIVEHTTDTAGYTDLVFGLFGLLGLQFSPRLRDLADRTLYRFHPGPDLPRLGPLVKGRLRSKRITDHWPELLRVAGSLKLGWVTASLLVSRLQASARQSTLVKALQEYGRLEKTIFIARWLLEPPYRRRIGGQLTRGERLHQLRRFLFFANRGQIRRRRPDEQLNQATCLNLVTNAIIIWNTVYITAILEQLRREGHTVRDEDVRHVSPARYEHINPYGRYRFELDTGLDLEHLRPLRAHSELILLPDDPVDELLPEVTLEF